MIKVIDNFFEPDLHDRLVKFCNGGEIDLRSTRSDANNDVYLTHHVYGEPYSVYVEKPSTDKFSHSIFEEVWNVVENKICANGCLESSYINALLYGMEAHPHVDSEAPDFVTVICYVSGNWNVHWGGETVFYDKEYSPDPAHQNFYTAEIIKSVLPKPNRIVVFKGDIMHSVRPLSKSFKGSRSTLMFKIENADIARMAECIAQ